MSDAPKRDCLGRPFGYTIADRKEPRLLSDEELTAIAVSARTQQPEAVRHLFPLIQHIVLLDAQSCETCQYWVGLADSQGTTGQCTRPSDDWPGAKMLVLSAKGKRLPDEKAHPCLITPFDWGCRGWVKRQQLDESKEGGNS